jgi:hypothetical protein
MFELFSRNLTPEEEDAVAAFMERVAVLPDAQRAPLPDPTVLWWRAKFVRRWNSERKAQAPLDVIDPIQIVAGLIAAGLLLVWTLPSVVRAFSFIGLSTPH